MKSAAKGPVQAGVAALGGGREWRGNPGVGGGAADEVGHPLGEQQPTVVINEDAVDRQSTGVVGKFLQHERYLELFASYGLSRPRA